MSKSDEQNEKRRAIKKKQNADKRARAGGARRAKETSGGEFDFVFRAKLDDSTVNTLRHNEHIIKRGENLINDRDVHHMIKSGDFLVKLNSVGVDVGGDTLRVSLDGFEIMTVRKNEKDEEIKHYNRPKCRIRRLEVEIKPGVFLTFMYRKDRRNRWIMQSGWAFEGIL